MDLPAALTLVFAGIGALGTVYSVVEGLLKRRSERNALANERAEAWSLVAEPTKVAGQWQLTIYHRAGVNRPVSVREMQIIEPHDADIAMCDVIREGPGRANSLVPTAEGWRKTFATNFLMEAIFNDWSRGRRQLLNVEYEILARLPASPGLRLQGRFRLRLTIEDGTASRRQSELMLTSQEVEFTAQVDPDAR